MFTTNKTFAGLSIHVSAAATRRAPRFPDKPRTKRRMRRVRGKYGSWDHDKPAVFQLQGTLVMHPVLFDQLHHAHITGDKKRKSEAIRRVTDQAVRKTILPLTGLSIKRPGISLATKIT